VDEQEAIALLRRQGCQPDRLLEKPFEVQTGVWEVIWEKELVEHIDYLEDGPANLVVVRQRLVQGICSDFDHLILIFDNRNRDEGLFHREIMYPFRCQILWSKDHAWKDWPDKSQQNALKLAGREIRGQYTGMVPLKNIPCWGNYFFDLNTAVAYSLHKSNLRPSIFKITDMEEILDAMQIAVAEPNKGSQAGKAGRPRVTIDCRPSGEIPCPGEYRLDV